MAKGIYGLPTPLVVLGIVAVLAFYNVGGVGTIIGDLWGNVTGLSMTGINPASTYIGNVQFIVNPQDALTAAVAAPTADAVTWFATVPSSMSGGTSLVYAGHTLKTLPSGECWLSFYGGDEFYLCEDKLLASNPGVFKSGTGFWKDLNADNTPEFVVAVDTSDIAITGSAQTPVINIVMPVLDDDVTIATTDPADVTALAAASTVTPITFDLTAIAQSDGTYISRLWFTLNNTMASNLCKFEELTLSGGWVGGGGQSFWSAPVEEVEGSTSYHYYITGDPDSHDYNNGERYWYKIGEPSTCYMTLNVRTSLAGVVGPGSHVIVIMNIETVTGNGVTALVSSPGTDLASH